MKIKVRLINPNCEIEQNDKGEWIDLRASKDITLNAPQIRKNSKLIELQSAFVPFGIAVQLPKDFEANIVPRSSTHKNFGIIQSNHFGVIDSTYSGNNDEWKMGVIALKESKIKEGDRIAQFRIRPSQFASPWTKLKWLFTNKIEFEFVDKLCNPDRDGFGSTGVH